MLFLLAKDPGPDSLDIGPPRVDLEAGLAWAILSLLLHSEILRSTTSNTFYTKNPLPRSLLKVIVKCQSRAELLPELKGAPDAGMMKEYDGKREENLGLLPDASICFAPDEPKHTASQALVMLCFFTAENSAWWGSPNSLWSQNRDSQNHSW